MATGTRTRRPVLFHRKESPAPQCFGGGRWPAQGREQPAGPFSASSLHSKMQQPQVRPARMRRGRLLPQAAFRGFPGHTYAGSCQLRGANGGILRAPPGTTVAASDRNWEVGRMHPGTEHRFKKMPREKPLCQGMAPEQAGEPVRSLSSHQPLSRAPSPSPVPPEKRGVIRRKGA